MTQINLEDYMRIPEKEQGKRSKELVFHLDWIQNETVRQELEGFLKERCKTVGFSTLKKELWAFDTLADFLNEKMAGTDSILTLSWEQMKQKYQVYLGKKGYQIYVKRNRKDRKVQEQKKDSDKVEFLFKFYHYQKEEKEKERTAWEKDLWDVREFTKHFHHNPIHKTYRLDFSGILQKKIREEMKEYIYLKLEKLSLSSLNNDLSAIRKFSIYLKEQRPEITDLMEVDRKIWERYILYLKLECGLKTETSSRRLYTIAKVIREIARMKERMDIYEIFFRLDYCGTKKTLPDPYSDAELWRFHEGLFQMNEKQLARLIMLHELLGTRISDVVLLKQGSIERRNGRYYLRIEQQKTKRTYLKPITEKIVQLIEKAQEETQSRQADTKYVFVREDGQIYNSSYIYYHIHKMIMEKGILGDDGEPFVFRTHRFRHTYGVKLAELGLDDVEIAKLLGHKNTRSLPHYRMVRSPVLAMQTKEIREQLNEWLKEYQKEDVDEEL